MAKRKPSMLVIILASAAVIQVAAIVIIFVVAPSKHEGRSAAEWAVGLQSEDEAIRKRAVTELAAGGVKSVPMLVELMRPPDPLAEFLGQRESPDFATHWRLGYSLEQAAVEIGPVAVDPLIGVLDDGDPASRKAAVRILSWLGSQSGAVRKALRRAFEDEEADVRWSAVAALGTMGVKSARETDALRARLGDSDLDVRVVAATTIWKATGEVDGLLGPLVEDLLREDGPHAPWVLVEMREAALPALPDLLRALSHDCTISQLTAARVLATFGLAASPAIPRLRALIAQTPALPGNRLLIDSAEFALACACPREPSSRTLLFEKVYDEGSRQAAHLLWNTGADRKRLLEVLLWPRGSETPLLPEIIEELGPDATEALPMLLDALDPVRLRAGADADATRLAAVRSLGRLGPRAKKARPALIRIMRESTGVLEPEAALAVFLTTGETVEPIRVLTGVMLRSGAGVYESQIAAVCALAVMAERIPEIADHVLRATRHEHPAVQLAAREALRRLRK